MGEHGKEAHRTLSAGHHTAGRTAAAAAAAAAGGRTVLWQGCVVPTETGRHSGALGVSGAVAWRAGGWGREGGRRGGGGGEEGGNVPPFC